MVGRLRICWCLVADCFVEVGGLGVGNYLGSRVGAAAGFEVGSKAAVEAEAEAVSMSA